MPPLIALLVGLAVIGVVVYLFNLFIPMDGKYKTAINAIVGLIVFIWIISVLFGYAGFPAFRIR